MKKFTTTERNVTKAMSTRIWRTPEEMHTNSEPCESLCNYGLAEKQMRDGVHVYRLLKQEKDMHYEEKVIEGVMYYRMDRFSQFIPVSRVQMTSDLLAARHRIEHLESELLNERSI